MPQNPLSLEDFRRWALGNLVDNRNRGLFAEWLVGMALDVIDKASERQEWDAYDLLYRDRKIEVKAAGRSQSWNPNHSAPIRFGIEQKKTSWSAATDTFTHHDQPQRFADVYVFCLHTAVPADNVNVADPDYWQFWVVRTSVLDGELGTQKSLGINRLDQIAEPVQWSDIRATVDECLKETLVDGTGD
ncbi:hypothetical protein [Candidatus Poriferisodalis sp.]|uniref:hypothetical protein n=1 Tax=Candidatus Poriferisodalis sp. TaxID=3101277 RepID=UPI003B020A57